MKQFNYSASFLINIVAILFLFSCHSSPYNTREQLKDEDYRSLGKPRKYELLIPKYLYRAYQTKQLDYTFIDDKRQMSIITNSISKDSIRNYLASQNKFANESEYLEFISSYHMQNTKNAFENFKAGEIKKIQINGMKGKQVDIKIKTIGGKEELKMRVTYLEGKSYLFMIICGVPAAYFETYTITFDYIINSFKQL